MVSVNRVEALQPNEMEARRLLRPASPTAQTSCGTPTRGSSKVSVQKAPLSVGTFHGAIMSVFHLIHAAGATWAPFAFRWYFIAIPTILSLLCGITTLILNRYSRNNNGLGTEGSAIFGWKFVPTLIAVLYTQLTAIILSAMKRTEPFARLAKGADYAPLARHTLLEKSRPWWTTLIHGFQKDKNGGSRSWSMVLSCAAFILTVLGISPISATLLYTKEVQWTSPAELTRVSLESSSITHPRIDRETYLRTTAAILQNYSTSPWVTDEHFILPFWPRDHAQPLWNLKSTRPQKWEAETIVFRNDYTCNLLELKNKDFQLLSERYKNYQASVIMESDDGCQYNLTRAVATDLATTAERNTQIGSWSQIPWIDAANTHQRGTQMNPSNGCEKEESIVMSTAWYVNSNPRGFLPDFNITAYACFNNHTMASMPVRASSTATGLSIDFDREVFDQIRQPVPPTVMNVSRLRDLYTDPEWYNYIPQKGYLNRSLGLFSGAGVFLGAKHRFDITEMINDPDLAVSAARIRRRAFAEVLRTSLKQPKESDLEVVLGVRIAPELRVLVNSQVAIALCTLFLISFCILLALMWTTRLRYRPLNLHSDPSTVLGLSALIASDTPILSLLKTLDLSNRKQLKFEFAERRYSTSRGILEEIRPDEESHKEVINTALSTRTATVPLLRIRNLVGLTVYILALLVTVTTLFSLSQRSNLHQALFTYRANLELFGGVRAFSPLTFISTLLAVAVTLWWESIDSACATLQPFIAMSNEPKQLSKGIGLSYQTTFWLWTSARAAKNKHWLLVLVTVGTFLTQAFTIAMSALFERSNGINVQHIDLNRTLELRHNPFVKQVPMIYTKDTINKGPMSKEFNTWVGPTLEEVFTDLNTNWMYTAMIQATMNGPDPTWSKDGWSFIPLDLSGLLEDQPNTDLHSPQNVTVQTPAIRARIDCSTFEGATNTSLWVKKFNESGVDSYYGNTSHGAMYIPRPLMVYNNYSTRIIAQATNPSCCVNSTRPQDADEGMMVVLAYWTENWGRDTKTENFTIKWLRGAADFDSLFLRGYNHMFFLEPPSIQAATCLPSIETAPAKAVVDRQTGDIRDFEILERPVSADVAWSDAFQFRNVSEEPVWHNSTKGQLFHHDVTTSYGILFMKTLLRAACLQFLGLERPAAIQEQPQEVHEKFFNMKDNTTGFNVDFMSYASYAQAGFDPTALLDPAALIHQSQKVFSTFFQHYVGSSISFQSGGWAYQPIGSQLKVKAPFYSAPQLLPNGGTAPKFEHVPLQNTSRTASATLSTQVAVLRMNPVAFWVAAAIMAWLLVTLFIFTAVQRRYLGGMRRNVECMADILVLVAGSERLLRLVEEKGVDALVEEDSIYTRLGWFRDDDGMMRWRIEVVEDVQIQLRSLSGSSAYMPVLNHLDRDSEDVTQTAVSLEVSDNDGLRT